MFIIPNHVLFFVCVCIISHSVLFNQRAFRTVKPRNADVHDAEYSLWRDSRYKLHKHDYNLYIYYLKLKSWHR